MEPKQDIVVHRHRFLCVCLEIYSRATDMESACSAALRHVIVPSLLLLLANTHLVHSALLSAQGGVSERKKERARERAVS